MNETIRHNGVVESTEGLRVNVRIKQTAACASCQIAGHCSASESKDKLVEAVADSAEELPEVGQEVIVTTTTGVARLALALVFGIPLLLMLTTIVVASLAKLDEQSVALLAIGVLIPYYIILWLFRHRIKRNVTFHVEETGYKA